MCEDFLYKAAFGMIKIKVQSDVQSYMYVCSVKTKNSAYNNNNNNNKFNTYIAQTKCGDKSFLLGINLISVTSSQ